MTWTLVVPVKVTSQAKTRLAGDLTPVQRIELVRAMVADTVAAARATPDVDRVVVVTDDQDVVADLRAPAPGEGTERSDGTEQSDGTEPSEGEVWAVRRAPLDIVREPTPAAGLNGAIRAGIAHARAAVLPDSVPPDSPAPGTAPPAAGPGPTTMPSGARAAHGASVAVAVLLGDLPALRPADLEAALRAARAHPRAVVPDADGTGTTLLTACAGVELVPAFGPGSAAAHLARGHVRLDVPEVSGLRQDVDLVDDLAAVAALGTGPRTAGVLSRLGALAVPTTTPSTV